MTAAMQNLRKIVLLRRLNIYYGSKSIIIPIHNGEHWIDDCFQSIANQTILSAMPLEISICDDASTDKTLQFIETWKQKLTDRCISLKVYKNKSDKPKGVGYAKNRAVEISTGEYLCFQDVDDIMLPRRIEVQHSIARDNVNAIIGGKFRRKPEDATLRFSRWANNLAKEQLLVQIYTSHGPTVIMPTWFCHRKVFDTVGGFSEAGHGTPEDLIFFYSHLNHNGNILRADEEVLVYVYHSEAMTFSINQKTIWDVRIARLEKEILLHWDTFTIWNAGKQGRRLFRSLNEEFQKKVVALCDVDKNKVGCKYSSYDEVKQTAREPIPIIHYTEAKPPFIICVKLDMTNGEFERNLKSLHLKEGEDFVLFS